jgi:hypothetical protein
MNLPTRCVLGLIATLTVPIGFAQPSSKPNIVVMLMDNLGGGIPRGAPTPTIDRLASEECGLLNFNVEAQCAPSRSAACVWLGPALSMQRTIECAQVASCRSLSGFRS